jgi:sugar lactone lactonase YvrE
MRGRGEYPEVTSLGNCPPSIGESPLWDHRLNVQWFVDIAAPAIFRFDPASGALRRFTFVRRTRKSRGP